jgi:hypothetical protein
MQRFLNLTYEKDGPDNYQIKPKIISAYKAENDKIDISTAKGYALSEDDVVYILPGTTIPRFKVRNKVKITNKPENATVAFVPSVIKDYQEINGITYSIHKGDLESFIDVVYDSHNPISKLIKSLLKNYEVVTSWRTKWDIVNNIEKWGNFINKTNTVSLYKLPQESEDLLKRLTCPIYQAEELLLAVSEDSLAIDHERYTEMRAMFKSADEDTIIMGMELLANADYDKSLLYILLLLKEFGHKFYYKKQVNHVNFKAMMNYIGLPKRKLKRSDGNRTTWKTSEYITLDDAVDILKKHNQFTKDNVSNITTLFIKSKPNDENKQYFVINALNINVNAF